MNNVRLIAAELMVQSFGTFFELQKFNLLRFYQNYLRVASRRFQITDFNFYNHCPLGILSLHQQSPIKIALFSCVTYNANRNL